ncbi:MAG: acylneuraminate cytidylyltransferase family protein [Alphaproteobacteria bacterium]|nr:acylneuraminate cytidylyltransferase family protein [Alphaproteobacteria bacterium]
MINGKSVIAIIVARGGSKGLPRKNVLDLGGKPLIAWSILAANASRFADSVVVSTDDDEIAAVATEFGGNVPFRRPPELATDEASVYDAIFHALDHIPESYDYVVLLQATSPLRRGEDIDAGLSLCDAKNVPSVVSVAESAKSPYWHLKIDENGYISPLFPAEGGLGQRQKLPTSYLPNGAVFVARTDALRNAKSFYMDKTVAYVMPAERSVDIDTALDLQFARFLMAERNDGPATMNE